MTNIKVTYGSIVRRLSISSTTTWSELENQFRNLFSIPQEIPIAVTYIDEDGDVITLSSDLELQEVLDNSSNNANTIKFALNIPNVNNLNNNREISIDTVIDEEETSNLINGLSAIQIKESNNDNNDNVVSGFKHVTITDEVDDPLFNQQRETLGENSKNSTKSINVQQENNNNSEGNENQENSDDDEHEIIVIITRNPWSHRRRARFGGRNPYYYPCVGRFRYGCHPHPHPHPEQGHGEQGGQGHNHGGYNRSGYFRGHGYGRYSRRYHHHHHNQQMSPEDVIEKVNTLNSMGFVEGDLEGLVKRYNGNLEFVIEALLFNKQNEQNSEVSNEDVVRKENDEKDQPMEVEEESGPYVL